MVSLVTYPIKGLAAYPEQPSTFSTFSKCGLSLPAGISRLCMYRDKHISFVSSSLPQQSRLLTQGTRNRSGVRNRSFFMRRQKKTPPKAGSLGFCLGVLPCFHSVKKPSSQRNHAFTIRIRKFVGISWLTDPSSFPICVEANSSQGLAPHTPRRRLNRLLFLCLGSPHLGRPACGALPSWCQMLVLA